MSPYTDKVPNNQEIPLEPPLQQFPVGEVDFEPLVLQPDEPDPLYLENLSLSDGTISSTPSQSEIEESVEIKIRDHTVLEVLRQTGSQPEPDSESVTLQIYPNTGSLQRISLYSPNIRELNLNNSELLSLRDISSDLRHLRILRVNSCGLSSLDGISCLINLRELYASHNMIQNLMPCTSLSHLSTLDVSSNGVRIRALSFLTSCRELRNLQISGNPCCDEVDWLVRISRLLPQLRILNESTFGVADVEGVEEDSSTSSNDQRY